MGTKTKRIRMNRITRTKKRKKVYGGGRNMFNYLYKNMKNTLKLIKDTKKKRKRDTNLTIVSFASKEKINTK